MKFRSTRLHGPVKKTLVFLTSRPEFGRACFLLSFRVRKLGKEINLRNRRNSTGFFTNREKYSHAYRICPRFHLRTEPRFAERRPDQSRMRKDHRGHRQREQATTRRPGTGARAAAAR